MKRLIYSVGRILYSRRIQRTSDSRKVMLMSMTTDGMRIRWSDWSDTVKFSERYGYKKVRDVIQIESVDEPLRNGLWNVLKLNVWDQVRSSPPLYTGYYLNHDINRELRHLCHSLWLLYFKKPLDELRNKWEHTYDELREYFFSCPWYEIYDFVEHLANNYRDSSWREHFTRQCNTVFERELSGYRFVRGAITPITYEHEIEGIEGALQVQDEPVREHLRRALELMSDRLNPDYRNSIKEAISAVESLVTVVSGTDRGTLGKLLRKLENELGLHPALTAAFGKLYGYSSDEGGIRHALLDASRVDFADAKVMLVLCSAFANYVKSKIDSSVN